MRSLCTCTYVSLYFILFTHQLQILPRLGFEPKSLVCHTSAFSLSYPGFSMKLTSFIINLTINNYFPWSIVDSLLLTFGGCWALYWTTIGKASVVLRVEDMPRSLCASSTTYPPHCSLQYTIVKRNSAGDEYNWRRRCLNTK